MTWHARREDQVAREVEDVLRMVGKGYVVSGLTNRIRE